MAELSKLDFEGKFNNSTTGLFKNNTNRDIGADDVRTLTEDITDSFFNKTDDAYTATKGNRAGITAPASLKDIVTVGMPFGVQIQFTDSTASNVVRIYELTNETTAESSPTVIRPNDYAGTTNEKVWRLRATIDVDSDTGIEHFKGVFASEAALNIAFPTADEGDYAYVDTGGTEASLYIWDDTDSDWVESGVTTVVPDASETVKGIIEIATQAEVTTGTDDVRAITPLKLATAVPAASETAAGIAELATQAETNTGTDDARIVTPLKVKNLDPSLVALVDGATIDITGPKHSLTTSSSRTFTISHLGDEGSVLVTKSTAALLTFTFPATALCRSDGAPTGNNTFPLSGASGDKFMISYKKMGSEYLVACANFEQ
jgi:hypothetical protein